MPPAGDQNPAAAAVKDARMLFVRGIATAVDETALSESFSALGPISQCFLVREKGQEDHKGIGFVQFALPEDAERAVAELNGTALKGRTLKVELANKRASLEERKKTRKPREGAEEVAAAEEPAVAAEPSAKALKAAARKAASAAKKEAAGPAAAAAAPVAAAAAPVITKTAARKAKAEAKLVAAAAAAAAPAIAPAAAPAAAEKVASKSAAARKAASAAKKKAAAAAAPAGGAAPIAVVPAAAAKRVPVAEKRAAARPVSVAEQKHRLTRAVALGNLTSPAVAAAALGLAKAAGKVEEVMSPAPEELVERSKLRADGCNGAVIVVIYTTVQDACKAVAQLHGAMVAQAPAAPQPKGKGKAAPPPVADATAVALWARQVTGEGAHVKQWRIIVRNLPFTVTEAQLRTVLSAAGGFVWELKIPRGPDGSAKGFAFAAFTCRAHAEAAITLTNGKKVGARAVAVDWAVAKAQFESGAKAEAPPAAVGKGKAGEEDGSEDGEEEDAEGDDSDDDVVGMTESEEGDDDDGEEEDEEEAGEEAEAAAAVRERSMLRNVMSNVLAGEAAAAPPGPASKDKKVLPAAVPAKGAKPAAATAAAAVPPAGKGKAAAAAAAAAAAEAAAVVEEARYKGEAGAAGRPQGGEAAGRGPSSRALACTVFVRGLALDCNPMDLRMRMENYGPLKACRMVMNKQAGKLKGTAFVEYMTEEGARKAAEACGRGRRGEGPGVVLAGGPLDVDPAVSQDAARTLIAEQIGLPGGGVRPGTAAAGTARPADLGKASSADRRNLYLAKEGEIAETSTAWAGMSDADKQKRTRAAAEKATKLKSPNFAVSATRLSVRNLPASLDEKGLAALFVRAVKERATKEKPQIKQAKILREEERPGEDGAPRSKGMGFVEFESAEHALVALRQLNNNPSAFTADKRPIVEFALENAKTIKAREQRQTQQAAALAKNKVDKESAAGASAAAAADDHDDDDGGDGGDEDAAAAAAVPAEKRKRKSRRDPLPDLLDADGAVVKRPRRDGGPEAGKATTLPAPPPRSTLCVFWDGRPGSCKRGDACIFHKSHVRGRATDAFRQASTGGVVSNAAAAAAARKGPRAAREAAARRGAPGGEDADVGGGGGAAAEAPVVSKKAALANRKEVLSEVGRQPGEAPNMKRRQQRLNRQQDRTQPQAGGRADADDGPWERAPSVGAPSASGGGKADGRKQLLDRAARATGGPPVRRERPAPPQKTPTGRAGQPAAGTGGRQRKGEDGGAAAAPGGGAAAKGEDSARQRKRQADEEMDRLADDGSHKAKSAPKRRKKSDLDAGDKLAQQYLARLVGAAGGGAGGKGKQQQAQGGGKAGRGAAAAPLALKKWFDMD